MICFSIIVVLLLVGMLFKPWNTPDYLWAWLGAAACIVTGSVSPAGAVSAVVESFEVIAFLIGMMMLSEIAADAGVFAWLADRAATLGRGRPALLFGVVYGGGTIVTMLLSNDATAVVMTPAVIAIARRADVDPIPLVLACAFISNAASFILPVANPANLVLYASHPPILTI